MNSSVINQWLQENERSISWLAKKIGMTRAGLHKSLKLGSQISATTAVKLSDVTGLDVRQICPTQAS